MNRLLPFSLVVIGLTIVLSAALGCVYDLGAAHAAALVVASDPQMAVSAPDLGFFTLITTGQYLPAVGIALTVAVAGIRTLLGRFVPWFGTKRGGYVLGFGSAALLYLGAAWQQGAPVSLGVFTAAAGAGWAASGGWESFNDLLSWFRNDETNTTEEKK